MIHEAGGVSVLAHPGQTRISRTRLANSIAEMAEFGLDGLEILYPSHSRKMRRRLYKIAARHGLAVSGGSDFHGENRPLIGLSTADSGYEVGDEILVSLAARRRRGAGDGLEKYPENIDQKAS